MTVRFNNEDNSEVKIVIGVTRVKINIEECYIVIKSIFLVSFTKKLLAMGITFTVNQVGEVTWFYFQIPEKWSIVV